MQVITRKAEHRMLFAPAISCPGVGSRLEREKGGLSESLVEGGGVETRMKMIESGASLYKHHMSVVSDILKYGMICRISLLNTRHETTENSRVEDDLNNEYPFGNSP